MLMEEQARWLLIAHAIVGAATVAVTTHLVVWMRGWLRGRFTRRRAVQRFALLSLALFAATFAIGNLAYPIYKVRVRAGYLEDPAAVAAAMRDPTPAEITAAADRTAAAARWFDVKEHWVALGLTLTAALTLILFAWRPKADSDSRVIAPYTLLMAGGAAGAVWIAAIIGVLTAAWRAI